MISRSRALELLSQHLKNDNLRKHCLASAAVMKKLASRLSQPVDEWEVTGLLHDLDFDLTRETPEKHALVAEELLKGEDFPAQYMLAVKAHNECTGFVRDNVLSHALAASESITGLIVACALVYPDKKISSVKVSSVKKRMKEKAFARNVSRENIMECEKCGVPFDEFVELAMTAMAEIQDQLI
ncbi:MAG: HDIG domain-containing protein [Candidatus Wallbacteria bacterium]|nr:HDIG domain-containing protein [Candidatus Wallbacteria bacterium]